MRSFAWLGEREGGTATLHEGGRRLSRGAEGKDPRSACRSNGPGTRQISALPFWRLGERESGTARLEEAVAAYSEALRADRARAPLLWARTKMYVGNAFKALGDREPGTARLTEAIAAFREALQEFTRERVPLNSAGTQGGLGNALFLLGEREGGTATLTKAVDAYREALKVRTRERAPLDWAGTQEVARQCAESASARGRAGRRGWRRPLPPIAKPCRKIRASACRSDRAKSTGNQGVALDVARRTARRRGDGETGGSTD